MVLLISDPLTVKLTPSRLYASPVLPCTLKVSLSNSFPGQRISITPAITKDSLLIWTPAENDVGSKIPVKVVASNNSEDPAIAKDSVFITVIADNELPPPPSDIKVSQRTSKIVKITWNSNSLVDSYILSRKHPNPDSGWENISLSDTVYIDSTRDVIMYRVFSVNFFGRSAYSDTVFGTDTIHYAHRVFFADTSSTASEFSGSHVVKVRVKKPAVKKITAWFSLKGNSDISDDFDISSDILATIAPGDTIGLCTLKVIDDTLTERNKFFLLYLDSVSHGYINGLQVHNILLVDDDSLYSVTYDENGAESGNVPVDSRSYAKNDVVVVMGNTKNLTMTGYSFAGWRKSGTDTSSKLYNPGDTLIMGAANIRLYAQWQANKYTVTYDGNGNTDGDVPAAEKYEYKKVISVENKPDSLGKRGFTFRGWNTSSDGSGDTLMPGDSMEIGHEDITLYALWEINKYKVKYNGNGNDTGSVPAAKEYDYNSMIAVAKKPSALRKTGFTFVGWNTRADGTGDTLMPGDSIRIGLSDTTLYALWERNRYWVKYDGNGNTDGDVPAAEKYEYKKVISVENKPDSLGKRGFTFRGWNTSSDGSGDTLMPGDSMEIGHEDITLYALWEINKYKVKYNGNGNDTGSVPAAKEYDYNSMIAVAKKPSALRKTGFTFVGWNTRADGTGDTLMPGDSIRIGLSDTTLYALWERNRYWVKYDGNGNNSGSVPDSAEYEYKEAVIVADKPDSLARTGFTYIGWNTKKDGTGDTLMPGDSMEIGHEDITLYALWEINRYWVKYDGNGNDSGSVPDSAEYDYGSKIMDANLKKQDYFFVEWNTASDGSGSGYLPGDTLVLGVSNTTLYAKWRMNPPEIQAHPRDTSVIAGNRVILSVKASGPHLSYQWQKGGVDIPGAASDTFVIDTATRYDSTTFRCKVSNAGETIISDAAEVRVISVAQVSAGAGHSLILLTDGTAWLTGMPDPVNTTDTVWSPVKIMSDVLFIHAGAVPHLVKKDGRLYQYISKDTAYLSSDVKYITSGGISDKLNTNVMLLKNDGTLWGTGYNLYGQLGIGTRTYTPDIVKITDNVSFVSAGVSHTLIIKDGSLYATGLNNGSFGDSTNYRDTTRFVKVAEDVSSAAAGFGYSLMINSNGELFASGTNSHGGFGIDNILSAVNFTQVATGISSVKTGLSYTMIITNDGTLMGSGDNFYGNLGIGTDLSVKTFTEVMKDIESISPYFDHTMIIKKDGTLWGTGNNLYGQLGTGTNQSVNKPELVRFQRKP